MREGSRYCETCGKLTPPSPGKIRVCYACGSLYPPKRESGRPLKTQREIKGRRSVKAPGR